MGQFSKENIDTLFSKQTQIQEVAPNSLSSALMWMPDHSED